MNCKIKTIISILALTLLSSSLAFAQKVTLSGYVREASSGEGIAGAFVYTGDKKYGVAANGSGYYALEVPAGKYVVKSAFTGFVTDSLSLDLSKSQVHNFLLKEDAVVLEAARIFSKSKREEISMPQMGKTMVDAALAKKLPAMGGETDIIRVIQMMPGVQTPSEGSTGFSVRGGGIDQNLVLIDDAPIFNSGHFLGFLSMFNSDAVKNAQLYKGDFPASYGGRNASVLDVSTNDGNMNHLSGDISIGLLDSKVYLEGPLKKEKVSFILAGRRTYMDIFFPLFGKKIPENTRINFYDLNAKISWAISDSDRLSLSAFSGRDVFGMSMTDVDVDKAQFIFMNNTQSLKWSHIFSPKLFFKLTAYNSRYDSTSGVVMDVASFDYLQQIREFGIKSSLTWYANANNTVEFGINGAGYMIQPGETIPLGTNSFVSHVKMDGSNAVSPSLYLQNEQKLGPVTLRYGLRATTFTTLGKTKQRYFDPIKHNFTDIRYFGAGEPIKTYWGLEPRFSAAWTINGTWALKAAYSRTYQYLQQALISISGSPVDSWFTASPNVKPQISDQVSAGFTKLFLNDGLELSLEAFYKHGANTMDFIDNSGIVLDNKDREGLLRFGESHAYGTELMLKYEFDKFNGWLSYTWSEAKYVIPEINGGQPYDSPLNHRHSVNFVFAYDFNRHWTASTDWVFYSGAATTYPVARYYYKGSYIPIYDSRNKDHMPDYHRLDLSVTYRTRRLVEGKRWGGELSLSIYNAYDRHNAWSLAFNYNREDAKAEAVKVYLFTIIPSISYCLKF
ncbi:MAG: TonB-dependent receptor [Bacteroidales bacterium]|nr:TonB-dependent receptor [Bacteroidales bacterium]